MQALTYWLVEAIDSVPAWAIYLIAWAVVFFETSVLIIGLIVPSEATLIAAGVAAGLGDANIAVLAAGTCIAAVAGDHAGYWVGRRAGPLIIHSRPGRAFGERRWDKVEGEVHSHGVVTVAAGRWIGYVRTLVPPVAGMNRMPLRRFTPAEILGACSWATTVLLLGYFLGAAAGARILAYTVLAAGGLLLVWFGYRVYRMWRRGPGADRPIDAVP